MIASTTLFVPRHGSFDSALPGGLVPRLQVGFPDPEMWDTGCSVTLAIGFCFLVFFFFFPKQINQTPAQPSLGT